MHFAYPPRKSSNPPPFRAARSGIAVPRRARLRTIALGLLAFIAIVYLLFWPSQKNPYHERRPSGTPPVVMVTALDHKLYSKEYLDTIKENRKQYAKLHGYTDFSVNAYSYDTQGAPSSWSMLMAMRHALTKYPDCKYVWYLDQDAYIMDMSKSLEEVVLYNSKLESLRIKDQPVVPPDSIIKTFGHLRANDIDLILSQDKTGLVHNNIILRNGEWAKFFLETWMDPLYRSYNFQKAERHALEHIVQWHATILAKLALVPQRTFASYIKASMGDPYQDGDFVAMFAGCTSTGRESCEAVSSKYVAKWKAKSG